MKSKKWDLNKRDYKAQLQSAIVWLAPIALVYLGQLLASLKADGFLAWVDFIPDTMTIGAIQLYVVNQVFGLFLKLKAGK